MVCSLKTYLEWKVTTISELATVNGQRRVLSKQTVGFFNWTNKRLEREHVKFW